MQLRKAGFLAKERKELTTEKSIKFNGGLIKLKTKHTSHYISLT